MHMDSLGFTLIHLDSLGFTWKWIHLDLDDLNSLGSNWCGKPLYHEMIDIALHNQSNTQTMTPARDPKQGKYMDLDLILIGFVRFSIRMG